MSSPRMRPEPKAKPTVRTPVERTLSYVEAVREATDLEMARDDAVLVFVGDGIARAYDANLIKMDDIGADGDMPVVFKMLNERADDPSFF